MEALALGKNPIKAAFDFDFVVGDQSPCACRQVPWVLIAIAGKETRFFAGQVVPFLACDLASPASDAARAVDEQSPHALFPLSIL